MNIPNERFSIRNSWNIYRCPNFHKKLNMKFKASYTEQMQKDGTKEQIEKKSK